MNRLEEPSHNEQTSSQSRTILLIEDDPDTAEMLLLVFRFETSYHVARFESGEDLLHRLETVKARPPALLILDYLLPGMTGLELYEQLTRQEEVVPIPTLLITATHLSDSLIERSGYPITLLHKPFHLDEFLRSVHTMIRPCLLPSGT